MKVIKIDWLDSCPKCGDSQHNVTTEHGSQEWLYDDDKVTCSGCGNTGNIDTDGEAAWVNWDNEE